LLRQVFQGPGDGLGAGARAAAETELPQLLRRFVVAVDHLIDVVDVELAGPATLDRLSHAARRDPRAAS